MLLKDFSILALVVILFSEHGSPNFGKQLYKRHYGKDFEFGPALQD